MDFITINIIEPMIEQIQENIAEVIDNAIDALVTATVNLIVGGISSLFGKRNISNDLQIMLTVMHIIQVLPSQLAAFLLPHINEIVKACIQHWSTIMLVLPFLEKHSAQILNFLETYTDAIIKLIEKVIPLLVDYSTQIFSLIGVFFNQMLPIIQQQLVGFWPNVRVGYVTALNELKFGLEKLSGQVLAQIVQDARILFNDASFNQIARISSESINFLTSFIMETVETLFNHILSAAFFFSELKANLSG